MQACTGLIKLVKILQQAKTNVSVLELLRKPRLMLCKGLGLLIHWSNFDKYWTIVRKDHSYH